MEYTKKYVPQSKCKEMENLGFPICRNRQSFFRSFPIYIYDLYDLLEFIPIGSKLMECFNGRIASRGISFIYDINNVADFLIEYYKSNPEWFDFK